MARTLLPFTADPRLWDTGTSHCRRVIRGSPIPAFCLRRFPARLRENYVRKFKTSIQFWHNVGGGLGEEAIRELKEHGYKIRRNGVSNYTIMRNSRVVFLGKIPDHTDDIKSTKDIPSWKRMCYCILKNDHVCRFMGFSLSREQQKNIDFLKEKYESVG